MAEGLGNGALLTAFPFCWGKWAGGGDKTRRCLVEAEDEELQFQGVKWFFKWESWVEENSLDFLNKTEEVNEGQNEEH